MRAFLAVLVTLVSLTPALALQSVCAEVPRALFDAYQDDIAVRVASFPDLFQKMMKGEAAEAEMDVMAGLFNDYGVAKLSMPPELLARIPVPELPRDGSPLDKAHWKRVGSPDKPIFARPIAGRIGGQGAVHIYVPKPETVPLTDFAHFNGPLHVHGDTHITVVTQGAGIFLIEADLPGGKRLVKIPVKRGDVLLIPKGRVHTFFSGTRGPFQVVSFNARMHSTETPEFLQVVSRSAKDTPFIEYEDFLRQRPRP